ncbi:cadherin-like domain-containing protein [Roseovarius aquimarinus]|uniref:Cadherin-like domain-containing protein n=1 Tax=Roseovarius aquimarinus TaxID=1229156 RepID=A0ABW7I686_9RHOB
MIDVKGTRSDGARNDPDDPLGLRQTEPSSAKLFSGWFVGLVALGLYMRSFLWPEPEEEPAAEEEQQSAPQDEADEPGLRKTAFSVPDGEDDEDKPTNGSTGTGAAEPAQANAPGLSIFPTPFEALYYGAPSIFSIDSGLPRDSANTVLPPFARFSAAAIVSDAAAPSLGGAQAGSGGGSAGSAGDPFKPEEDNEEPDDPAEEPRGRAPRNKGPVYLADVGSGAAVGFALSFFLSQTADADDDPLTVEVVSATSGDIAMRGDGWRYIADTDFLGEVRIDYTVSDGQFEIAQSAYLNVVENVFVGSQDDDLLVGTHGRDMIDGQAGDDNLAGLGGRDRMFGHDGDDNIAGGDGNDTLFGGEGNDLIVGGAGDDWISGGAGQDSLYGDAGDDEIHGDAGDDAAFGGMGDDTISGGNGNDTVHGGAGADILAGDDGDDHLYGGDGADVLTGGMGDDTAFGGAGRDIVFGNEGNDALHGGEGADVLSGDAGDDHLDGGADADVLTGGSGSDVVLGGAGDDLVIADDDAVADRFSGGDGHDRLDYSAATEAVILDLVSGIASGESVGEDSFDAFEHYTATARNDVFHAAAGQATLTGNGGADLYSFVQGDTVDIIRSIYQITDYDSDDEIWISMGSSRYHIRKAQKTIEDRIEDGLEDYADSVGADEPRLSFHFDWTETYRRTAIEVDFDRDKVVDLEVMLDGEHLFVVEHA